MGKRSERPLFCTTRADGLRGNRLFWTAVLLAIATLLSAIKPVELPDGGAVTYFSLLFLWLVTFFYGPRYGLAAGAVFGILRLGACYVLAANLFYPPDRDGLLANLLFTIVYDMSYLGIEAALTMLLLCIPAVCDAIYYVRFLATTPKSDPTLRSF